MKQADLISMVEASYDLGCSEVEWLQELSDQLYDFLRPGHGMLAYHVEPVGDGFAITQPVQSGPSTDLVQRIEGLAQLLERRRRGEAGIIDRVKAKLFTHVMRQRFREPVNKILLSEFDRRGPEWAYNLGTGVHDVFSLANHHLDGHGATCFFGGLSQRRVLTRRKRTAFLMLGAHIKAGLRLRRRLPIQQAGVDVPPDGAVLTPSGRVLHAEGAATEAIR